MSFFCFVVAGQKMATSLRSPFFSKTPSRNSKNILLCVFFWVQKKTPKKKIGSIHGGFVFSDRFSGFFFGIFPKKAPRGDPWSDGRGSRSQPVRLAVICTASPCATDTEHTINTLRLGAALAGFADTEEKDRFFFAFFFWWVGGIS